MKIPQIRCSQILCTHFNPSVHGTKYHLLEANRARSISDIIADNVSHQPNFHLVRDLADKRGQIKAAANVFHSNLTSTCALFSILYFFRFKLILPYADNTARCTGSFKIPFWQSSALSIEGIVL